MSNDAYSSLAWDSEPAATLRREQQVLIAKAKHETAQQMGLGSALSAVYIAHDQLQSWPLAFLTGAAIYWLAISSYKKNLEKAKKDYVFYTGKSVDFI